MSDRDRSTSPIRARKPYGDRTIAGRDTNSNDPQSLRCRLFIGNLATDKTTKVEVEELFSKFGELASLSLHNNYGFVQYTNPDDADKAVEEVHGKTLFGKRVDVNLAGARRKPQVKDSFEGVPVKDHVVPPDVQKPKPRRERSPHHARDRDNQYGREAGTLQRPAYEPFNHPSTNRNLSYDQRPNTYGYGARRDPHNYRADYHRETVAPRIPRPAIDCEIVALSKELTRYAEEVEARLRSIGLVCNIGYPPAELPIPELMDRIARTGTLYAITVSEQNSQHRSCTLNILHGTRQEHRNMPLDDALSFMAKNFDAYLKSLREPVNYAPPASSGYMPPAYDRRPPHVPHAPVPVPVRAPVPVPHQGPAASYPPAAPPSEKQMSTDEIEAMIEKLKREKEQREAAAAAAAPSKPPTDPERYAELSNQIRRESTDMPASHYAYDKYAQSSAPQPSSNGTAAIPSPAAVGSGYYQQVQPPPSYR